MVEVDKLNLLIASKYDKLLNPEYASIWERLSLHGCMSQKNIILEESLRKVSDMNPSMVILNRSEGES